VLWLGVSWVVWWFPRAVHCAAWLAPILVLSFDIRSVVNRGRLIISCCYVGAAMSVAGALELVQPSPVILAIRLVLKLVPVRSFLLELLILLSFTVVKRRMTGAIVTNPRRIYKSISCVIVLFAAHTWAGWCWHPGLLVVLVWVVRISFPIAALVTIAAAAYQVAQGRFGGNRRTDKDLLVIGAVSTCATIATEAIIYSWCVVESARTDAGRLLPCERCPLLQVQRNV
jgi:hypothetical protein